MSNSILDVLGAFWNTFVGLLNTWPINWIFSAFGITLAIILGAGLGFEILAVWWGRRHPEEVKAFRALGEIGKDKFDPEEFLYRRKHSD